MAANESRIRRRIGCIAVTAVLLASPDVARAEESGISFWLPGQSASLAAVPQTPGWALGVVDYHTSIGGSEGDMKGFLGLRVYGEFDASNRASGWNSWLTFSISQAAPTEATPRQHLITK